MPHRRAVSVPSYRLHKQSGQAVVTLRDRDTGRRKDILLGTHGTPESRAEYARVIGEWEAANRRVYERQSAPDMTSNELAAAFWPYIESHYRAPDGTPTKEVDEFKLSLKPLKIKEQSQSVPVLIAARKDLDVNIRRAAAAALGEIGEREKTVPALKAALNDREVLVREAAKRALTKLDGKRP